MRMMNRLSRSGIPLLFALLCCANMCFYWNRIQRASEATPPSAVHTKAKFLTDLYPPWVAACELLLNHRDPYGPDVTREIQLAYFGGELDPSHLSNLSDAQIFSLAFRFAYPLYVVFFVAPLIWVEFHTAQIIFWWFLFSVTLASVYLWLRFVGLQLRLPALLALLSFLLTSVPAMQGLRILQLGLVVAALFAAAAFSAARGHLAIAGALLALTTIRPQMCILVIAWFALWMSGAWVQRLALLWGFLATLAILLLASQFLLSGWLLRYPSVLGTYAKYTGAWSLLGMLMPSTLHMLIIVAALIVVVPFCWRARLQPANSASFAVSLAFTLTLTVSIVPTVVASFNQILLLPAILLVIRYWSELQQRTRPIRMATLTFALFGFLPWLLALVVTGFLALRHDELTKISRIPLQSSLALPFVVFGLLALMRSSAAIKSVPLTVTELAVPARTASNSR